MLTASELKTFLRTNNLRLSKRLGQNHLVDPRALRRIVDAVRLNRSDTVVEIGAGLGALTELLAKQARHVIAIEIDSGFSRRLAERMKDYSNVTVINKDVLKYKWKNLDDVVVVGAIPYSVTSPILIWLCENQRKIKHAAIVIQKEVAQRLVAKPSTKAYGRLTILGQYFWQIKIKGVLSRSSFYPQPNVDSAYLFLERRKQPLVFVSNEKDFLRFVQAAFSQRRKTLVNCLCGLYGKKARLNIETVLSERGVGLRVRAEALSLKQLAEISEALNLRDQK